MYKNDVITIYFKNKTIVKLVNNNIKDRIKRYILKYIRFMNGIICEKCEKLLESISI